MQISRNFLCICLILNPSPLVVNNSASVKGIKGDTTLCGCGLNMQQEQLVNECCLLLLSFLLLFKLTLFYMQITDAVFLLLMLAGTYSSPSSFSL